MAETIDGVKAPEGGFKQGGWYEGRQYWGGSLGSKGVVNEPGAVGYGERVSDEVNLQSDAAAGLRPGAIKDYLNLGGIPKFSSAGDAAKFANAGQSNFGGESGVQSRADIQAGIEGELGLGDRPEVPSMLESFKTQKTEAGLDSLQDEINELTRQERDEVAIGRQRKAGEEGKPEALGVIAGRVSEIERQEAERMDVIQRNKAYKIDQYNSALSSIQMIMSFTQQDYDNATASFNTQFTQGLQMIDAVSGIQREQKDDAQRAKDNANATLGVMMNAITSGNMNYSNLSSDQRLNVSKLEAQSGLPIGFVSNLRMSPNDKILNINSDTGEALIVDENGNFEVKKTGMTISPSKAGGTASERAKAAESQIRSSADRLLSGMQNTYGHVSPGDWSRIQSAFIQDGGTTKEFVSNFSKYTDPNREDFLSSYGFDTKLRGIKEDDLF